MSTQNLESNTSKSHRYRMGLIGNCSYSALVDCDANVSWMCWPRFDSSFIFGSLLDKKKGGEFSIKPAHDNYTSHQYYLDNTNILVTLFTASDGEFEVIDFAPRFQEYERYHKPLMLMRKVRRISGHPRIRIVCSPVGEYGKLVPETQMGSNHLRYAGLESQVRLTTNASLTMIQQKSEFALTEDLYLVLSWGIPLEAPLKTTFDLFFTRTEKYWQNWVRKCALPQVFQKEVIRSALALKLHQYEDTGAVVASFTTSLPEIPGEGRNWDYRYCWLRDTYYTIAAFYSLGHFEEGERFALFIENLNIGARPSLQPVYCIDGKLEMPEFELPLQGYFQNTPVRVGNAAVSQTQHDAYGQVVLALYNLYTDARILDYNKGQSSKLVKTLLSYIRKTMKDPDNGIWEFRGRKSLHAYSLLFQWAGSSACYKIARHLEDFSLEQEARQSVQEATALLEQCWNPEKQVYTQYAGSDHTDASLLQMITLGYFDDKPREKAIAHLRGIQKELELTPGFFLRYAHDDDFGQQRSAFTICSFWFVEALLHLDFTEEARNHLKTLLKTQNHLGLMSEDFDVESNSQWGNFPQSYSHVGLINCAFALDRSIRKPGFLLLDSDSI
ncbi:MAG: glycoside hydrolase family 15 protein [Bdellovibrionales bacterium]